MLGAVRRRMGLWLGALASAAVLGCAGGAAPATLQPAQPLPPPRADVELVSLPADLVFDRTVGAEMAVVFRHTSHVEFAGRRCIACHPAPFRMLAPERKAEHPEMDEGGSCGSCHDGQRAFATTDEESCEICHVGLDP